MVGLTGKDGQGELIIEDDGDGFPKQPTAQPGVGLSIMNYRAVMVGGSLKVQPNQICGVTVCCKFPLRNVE